MKHELVSSKGIGIPYSKSCQMILDEFFKIKDRLFKAEQEITELKSLIGEKNIIISEIQDLVTILDSLKSKL